MARRSKYTNTPVTERCFPASWKTALYLRLSVEDGDDVEKNSIGNQKKLCIDYLEKQRDMTVVETFIDNGFSGMSYKRPGFTQMYEAINKGQINCVIVKDISRFGREYITTSDFLQRVFPSMGVRLICVNDDYDSEKPDTDIEGLLLPFKMIINDSYAKDTSKKIRSSITAKMNAGEFLPSLGSIPYGYIRNPAENTFTIDPEAAQIVELIFRLRSEGMAFNAIAKQLNDREIPSPGKLRYIRGISKDQRFEDSKWIRGTIRKMTNDPVYIGNRVHGKIKRDRLGEEKTARAKSEWQIIPDAHPSIISQELFDRVQKVNKAELERQGRFQKRAAVENDCRDLLRDKVFCGDCGSKMIALKRNQRDTSDLPPVIFYNCNGYKYSNGKKCSNHYTTAQTILTTLRKVMDTQVAVAADLEIVAASAKAKGVVEREAGNLQSIRVRRRNIEAKQERLLMDLADGLLNREEYEYTKAQYIQKREALMAEERLMERKLREMERSCDTAQTWLKCLKQYKKVPVLSKEIIDLIVDRILIYHGNRMEIRLNYENPYTIFSSIPKEKEVTGNAGKAEF